MSHCSHVPGNEIGEYLPDHMDMVQAKWAREEIWASKVRETSRIAPRILTLNSDTDGVPLTARNQNLDPISHNSDTEPLSLLDSV